MSHPLKLKYKNIVFSGYLDLLYFFIRNNAGININLFPYSKFFYTKAALENKFNRSFSKQEIMKILNDKSWQWRTSSQAL